MRKRKGCPGCSHDRSRHVGGTCYGPPQLVLTPLGLAEMVSGCFCGWSYIDRPEYVGWWDWRDGQPPGVRFLQVLVTSDVKPPRQRPGHYRGRHKRLLASSDVVEHPEPEDRP